MNDNKEQKEAIKKYAQEFEAKILLNNLKEEQKAVNALEKPYHFAQGLSWWGWSIVCLLVLGGIGIYSIAYAHEHFEIASGVLLVVMGIMLAIESFFARRLNAIRYLILNMRKDISDLKAKLQ